MLTIILTVFVLSLGVVFYRSVKKIRQNKDLKNQLNRLPKLVGDFKMDNSYKNRAGLSLIAVDDAQKKVLLASKLDAHQIETLRKFNKKAELIKHKVISYQDIVRSELVINNKTVNVKSASGLQVGCVSEDPRSANSKKYIKNVKLKLVLKDTVEPAFVVPFYNKKAKKLSPVAARKECERWHESIGTIISN